MTELTPDETYYILIMAGGLLALAIGLLVTEDF
jgi:hypothetical protein